MMRRIRATIAELARQAYTTRLVAVPCRMKVRSTTIFAFNLRVYILPPVPAGLSIFSVYLILVIGTRVRIRIYRKQG